MNAAHIIGMTFISPAAEAAREASRHTTGQFGVQEHTAPELTLSDYTYPALIRDLRPDQVDINLWYRENEDGRLAWHVSAYPISATDNGCGETDATDPLVTAFEVTLPEELTSALDDNDNWTTLAQAPDWLKDTVMPSIIDEEERFNSRKVLANLAWRKDQHARILAAGGHASSYDNEYIAEFEYSHPTNTAQDAAAELYNMPPLGEDACGETDRELAAAELSRRAAAGVGGTLIDVRQLRPGDQVSVTHLAEHFSEKHKWDIAGLPTVESADSMGAGGDVIIRLKGGALICLPTGSRLPTVTLNYQGSQLTTSALISRLVAEGEVSYRASKTKPAADIIDQYHRDRALNPSDAGWVSTNMPKPHRVAE